MIISFGITSQLSSFERHCSVYSPSFNNLGSQCNQVEFSSNLIGFLHAVGSRSSGTGKGTCRGLVLITND